LSKKGKFSVFKTDFVPILTYGYEFWIMTGRIQSQVQVSETRFLRRIELRYLAKCVALKFKNL